MLPRQLHVERPVFLRYEGADFPFPVDDQAQGHGLDPARRQSAAHLLPEQGADLVTHQPVQDAARQLCVHLVLVDSPRVLEGLQDGVLGDFVKEHPVDIFGLARQFFVEVLADGFPFAIGVGREIDVVDPLGRGAQFLDHLHLGRDHAILGREVVLHVHAQFALGQVLDMADRRFDDVIPAKVFADGLRLGWGFHHYQCLAHRRRKLHQSSRNSNTKSRRRPAL